jgi:uncharacterized protein DUF6519
MTFDCSRFSFHPWKDFFGVVMQQGRVQLDSDWNEWVAEMARRLQAGTMDTLGRAVVPRITPNGFHILATGGVLTIGPGRVYVDGLLAENHGGQPLQWDPALAELTGTADLPFFAQPYLPFNPTNQPPPADIFNRPALTGGPHLVYLDVWQRELSYLQDPDLIEKAVGVDTTARLQTVWQVKLLPNIRTATCTSPDSDVPGWSVATRPSGGRLTNSTGDVPGEPSPCLVPPAAGYKGLENQLYRVEIHRGGPQASATFKWSRDNATVASRVTEIQGGNRLVVESLGRDDVLGFHGGEWIEILDDWHELHGFPGLLRRIRPGNGVDAATRSILLDDALPAGLFPVDAQGHTDPGRHTRIRRWDQSHIVRRADGTAFHDLDASASSDGIPVPAAGTRLALENGILVEFTLEAGVEFKTGDYWVFAARVADGSIEPLDHAPPRGIHHHYARLAIVTFPDSETDCRVLWPPETTGESCECTVCVEVADYLRDPGAIAAALEKVSSLGGGRVCLGSGTFPLGGKTLQIAGLHNVTLSGQGPATVLAYVGTGPAVTIDMCLGQRIENLSIVALPLPPVPPPAETGRQIPIGLLVRNSVGVDIWRCGIAAPTTNAQSGAPIAGANGAAVVLDGVIGASGFDENVLIADLGVAAAASLVAAGIMPGGSQAAPPPLALAGCTVVDNLMTCPIAGVAFGEAGKQPGAYFYFSDNAIAGNKVLGGAFAGIFAEGLTAAGAAVHIMRNDLEVLGTGIDARLDGLVIADNVVTQADLALLLPGGPAKTGTGIAVRGVTGVPPIAAQLHRNRIVGIAGAGILLDAPLATISVIDNAIFGTTGFGITTSTSNIIASAADLLVRGNEVLIVADSAPSTGGGAAGILAWAIDATIENNTVGAIGNAAGGTGSAAGIFVLALASAKITANRIHDIGPPPPPPPPPAPPAAAPAPPPISYGILAGAFDHVAVFGNIVQQATTPLSAAGNFTGIKVDESFVPSGPVAVSVEGNIVEGSSAQPLIQISNQHPGVADCVVTANQCRQQIESLAPSISIDAATAIVSNNRVGGAGVIALSVNVTRQSGKDAAATIVGNIISGDIHAPGLRPVFTPLNVVIAPP